MNKASLDHKNLRRKWFWSKYTEQKANRDLKYIFQLGGYYELLSPNPEDISWWLEDAFNTTLANEERQFAIRAAMTLMGYPDAQATSGMTAGHYIRALCDGVLRYAVVEHFRNKIIRPIIHARHRWQNTWGSKYYWERAWRRARKVGWTCFNWAHFTIKHSAIANGKWEGATFHILRLAKDQMQERSSNNWSGGLCAADLMVPFGRFSGEAALTSLKFHWVKHLPILPYEKENRHSTSTLTVLGLMALDVLWSSEGANYFESLSESEADIATRLALNELNGLPVWLPSVAHGNIKVVERVLTEAITAEWNIAKTDLNMYSDVLARLRYQEDGLPDLIVPVLKRLLLDGGMGNDRVLLEALRILIKHDDHSNFDWLIEVAKDSLRKDADLEKETSWTWLLLLMSLDAAYALDYVEAQQRKKDPVALAITLCGRLASRRDLGITVERPDYATPQFLKRLVPWVYKYIPPKNDPVHEGAFSPQAHDEAVTFRGTLLERLISADDGYVEEILKGFSTDPIFEELSDWIYENLDRWKDRRADKLRLHPEDLLELLGNHHERTPRSRDDLFHLAHRKIVHFKEQVERAEISIRHQAHIGVWKEKDYQRWIQGHLDAIRNARYTVTAESEIDPGKFPDLRFEAAQIDGAISVEVKLATSWSYTELLQGLHGQLVGQYLRAANANFGIYLLFYDGDQKHWEPIGQTRVNWPELIDKLQDEARQIKLKRFDIDQLVVIGVDVTKPS